MQSVSFLNQQVNMTPNRNNLSQQQWTSAYFLRKTMTIKKQPKVMFHKSEVCTLSSQRGSIQRAWHAKVSPCSGNNLPLRELGLVIAVDLFQVWITPASWDYTRIYSGRICYDCSLQIRISCSNKKTLHEHKYRAALHSYSIKYQKQWHTPPIKHQISQWCLEAKLM